MIYCIHLTKITRRLVVRLWPCKPMYIRFDIVGPRECGLPLCLACGPISLAYLSNHFYGFSSIYLHYKKKNTLYLLPSNSHFVFIFQGLPRLFLDPYNLLPLSSLHLECINLRIMLSLEQDNCC
jgi:hypothetical protein